MAHRALVVYERHGDRYDLHLAREAGFGLRDDHRLGGEPHRDPVDPSPLARGLRFEAALSRVDPPSHEALYLVGEEVRAFRVLWYAVPAADGLLESPGNPGALVAAFDLEDPEPDGYLRGWFEATREAVGELVDRGLLDEREAIRELRDRLHLFAGDEVEVIDLPAR